MINLSPREITLSLYTRITKKPLTLQFDYQGQKASDLILETLKKDKPCIITRFGKSELCCTTQYQISISQQKYLSKLILYLTGISNYYKISKKLVHYHLKKAGFFPPKIELLPSFAEIFLKHMGEIDILGSWLDDENYFKKELSKAKKIPLVSLEPYFHERPWSSYLEGKTVLVIHPFSKTIESQYQKRHLLFKNPQVLPDFELKTMKAVQSLFGHDNQNYHNWFEALEGMKKKIHNTSFDVAIIGCGGYGLPLAAYVKKIGKKAIHLGGATQILFGIKGARWEKEPQHIQLFNEHWVRPDKNDRPKQYQEFENGCYW